jgi:hypothetical protein
VQVKSEAFYVQKKAAVAAKGEAERKAAAELAGVNTVLEVSHTLTLVPRGQGASLRLTWSRLWYCRNLATS